jgi:hypothetical protein
MEIKEMLYKMKMFLVQEVEDVKSGEVMFLVLDESNPGNKEPELMTYTEIVKRYHDYVNKKFDF